MWKISAMTTVVVATLSVSAGAQDVRTVIANASKTMGAANLTSIVISGTAAQGNFGQSRVISFRLASTQIRNYTRAIDFTQPASHATGTTLPPAVRGAPPPQPGTYDQNITPA